MQLDEVSRRDITCWQLASAGKIDNLHQVCGVFGMAVYYGPTL